MIKGGAARGERRKQRERNRRRARERERKGEGEEGSSVAPHLDPEQRQDVHGGPINGALLRVMKSFLSARQTDRQQGVCSSHMRNSGAQEHSTFIKIIPRRADFHQ